MPIDDEPPDHESPDHESTDRPTSPLEALRAIGVQEVAITPTLAHLEIYTLRGLLTLLWHGPRDADRVVLMGGGAMGGLLGPADGLFHDLGEQLASDGIGAVRLSYREPNNLPRCVHDMMAVADLAGRKGAETFITMGHSFGGAVAVGAAAALLRHTAGVVLLATQSAGCERVAELAEHDIPLLLFHGDVDEILPPFSSEMVLALASGHGELVLLPGNGHLLSEAGALLRERLGRWIPDQFDRHHARAARPSDD
jgi:pimeloyl-ACP methyl ester carboxylesterase